MSPVAPWRVVVAGGGIAGVEALLGLAAHGEERLQLALVTPGLHFTLRPQAVGEAFGKGDAPSVPYADLAREQDARFVRDRVTAVDPTARTVALAGGGSEPYDALVLAVGARAATPHPAAVTFDGPRSVPEIRRLVGDLTHRRAASVAFVVPEGVTWPLPMYELALMTRGRAQRREVLLVTSEAAPLEVFGAQASAAVADMLDRAGVELHAGADPEVAPDGRSVALSAAGPMLPVDRVVLPPILEGPELPGVPHDAGGFIPVDEHGRVVGCPRVYAAGDGTDAPVKQGGLAAQQAHAAVRHLVAAAGGPLPPEPFRPVLRGRVMTGGLDRYLRHDPEGEDLVLDEPLWLPAAKVVGQHLGPWLAHHRPDAVRG